MAKQRAKWKEGSGKRSLETKTGEIDSDSLCTPYEIAQPLLELYRGPVDVDPCSNPHSIIQAKKSYYENGLWLPWGRRTFMNEPYSANEPWVDKAIDEMKCGRVQELVVLCMTATSTRWWSNLMNKPKRNPRVICTKRLKFLGPGSIPLADGARFDTSLIYYGAMPEKFAKLFSHVAMWTTWGR